MGDPQDERGLARSYRCWKSKKRSYTHTPGTQSYPQEIEEVLGPIEFASKRLQSAKTKVTEYEGDD